MQKIKRFFFIFTLVLFNNNFSKSNTIKAEQFAPLACAVVTLSSEIDFAPEFIQTVLKDLQFTQQFVVTPIKNDKRFPLAIVKECAAQKIPFVLFLKQSDTTIDWWLYDALSGSKIAAKRYVKVGRIVRGWAHQVVDMIWEILTSRPGFFGTKIVYCKESGSKRGISLKSLCIADYDGSFEQVIVDSKTVLLAPRWHGHGGEPVIFYSEETMRNTRLLSIDLKGRCLVVSNNPGINMLIAFNRSGTQAVYSASDEFGYSQIVLVTGKGLASLTYYKANSLGPVIADDGKIYFYSDAFSRMPQICMYDHRVKHVTQITKTGYNAGPAYCSHTGMIAYTSMKNKYMQIFLFDPKSGIHRQLTKDLAHKEDCSWSPGGDFLLVSVTHGAAQRLALYNITTNTYTYITNSKNYCSDSHWSPCYKEFPVLFD